MRCSQLTKFVRDCRHRRLREQVKEGVDQLSALLESVMLLGQLAQDIAVVKADIKQVRQSKAKPSLKRWLSQVGSD